MAAARYNLSHNNGRDAAPVISGNPAEERKALIPPVTAGIKTLRGNNSILRRAADSWELLTNDEKEEYRLKAGIVRIEGIHLFMFEYLRMSGLDIPEHIINRIMSIQ